MESLAGQRYGNTRHRPVGDKTEPHHDWGKARAGPGVQASHSQEGWPRPRLAK